MKCKQYVISLHDHISALFEWMEEMRTSKPRSERNFLGRKTVLPFNHVPFLDAVLAEVFDKIPEDSPAKNFARPKDILKEEGLSDYDAEYICRRMYSNLLTHVGNIIPDLQFIELEHHNYGMCGEFDVMITIPEYPE